MKKGPLSYAANKFLLQVILLLGIAILIPQAPKASVTWGTSNAYQWQDTIVFQWTTATETGNVQFWVEVPQMGLFIPFGPYPSSVGTSTTPTNYEVRMQIPALITGGNVCAYIWPDDGSGPNSNNSSPITCTYITTASTLLWPGDANSDGAANVTDLLYIGLANTVTGPSRPGASTAWVGQSAMDWTTAFVNGINHKFADCDGNGTINLADTVAINLNYGMTHSKSAGSQTGGVPLTFVYPDSANGGDTLDVEIWLGDATNPVSQAYGLSFSMQHDSSQVKTGKIWSSLHPSWFGTPGTDLVRMNYDDQVGQFDMGATRTNGVGVNGYGKIGSIGIVLVDNLGKTNFDARVLLDFVNPLLLNAQGNPMGVELSVALGGEFVHEQATNGQMMVFPNPATNLVQVEMADAWRNATEAPVPALYDMMGRRLPVSFQPTGQGYQLDLSPLANGSYFIQVNSSQGRLQRRLLVQH